MHVTLRERYFIKEKKWLLVIYESKFGTVPE